tara:strand:+ start:318 stop:1397 length:1080 start_codon:yes stop_codon:yes gene_type:complete
MNEAKDKFNKIKVLIVGSGIIGKSIAFKLSDYGFNITIVDQDEIHNSSNAALGILMGKIYQKRKGRSWLLRQKSSDLWPKWMNILQSYNSSLKIEKPLFQLTNDQIKFKKLTKFANNYPHDDLELVEANSSILYPINKIFKGNKLQGIISHHDGRINPKVLLETLDIALKSKNIKTINNQVIKIKKNKKIWNFELKTGEILHSKIVILCNSLDSLKLINPETFDIKLKPVLGQAIEIFHKEKNTNFLSLPKLLNINGKNLITISKEKIIIGSTDEYDFKPKDFYLNELFEFLENKPNWLDKKYISRRWFGIRSRPEGEPSPLLKSLEKGLILCSGFYKNGILLAPACSHWVSEEIKKHI